MSSTETTKRVIGKRSRNDSTQRSGQRGSNIEPGSSHGASETSTRAIKRQKISQSCQKLTASSLDSVAPVAATLTERAKRAERRASLGRSIHPNRKRNEKTTRTTTAPYNTKLPEKMSVEAVTESITKDYRDASAERYSNMSWKTILNAPRVAKALKEYEAAQLMTTNEKKIVQVTSMKTDLFSRRTPKAGLKFEPVDLSKASTQHYLGTLDDLPSLEGQSNSDTPSVDLQRKYTGASMPDYYRLGSLVTSISDIDHQKEDAPLADFTRRLSSAALVLARSAHLQPDSEDSNEVEENARTENETVSAASAAQKEVYSNMFEMMQRMVQHHEETRKVTEELLVANKLEAQRLATLIATQPPSAPPPVDSRREVEIWNQIAYENQRYGAIQAFATYSKLLCGDNSHTYAQIIQPSVNAPHEDVLQLLADNRGSQPQERPDYFFSTRSLMSEQLRQVPGVFMTRAEMYDLLKGHETRYKLAFKSDRLGKILGGTKHREENPSQYPLLNQTMKERHVKEREDQFQIQTVFWEAMVANIPHIGQQIVSQQDDFDRKPSWAMMDAGDIEYDKARKQSSFQPAGNSLNNFTLPGGGSIVFGQSRRESQPPPQLVTTAQAGPMIAKMCPFFMKGSCKFGDGCKMSHGQSAPVNLTPLSSKTEQLNRDVNTLQWCLGKAVDMSYIELVYNNHMDSLVDIINNGTTEIISAITFATSDEVSQSLFNTPVTQGLERIMNIWWNRISPTRAMPLTLFDAVTKLGKMINYANNKIGQPPSFASQVNYTKANFTHEAHRDPHLVLGQELYRNYHRDNYVGDDHGLSHAWTDLQQRAIFEDQLHADNRSTTRLDHVLDRIVASGKHARKPGLEWNLDWIIRQGEKLSDNVQTVLPYNDISGQLSDEFGELDDGASYSSRQNKPFFNSSSQLQYAVLPLLTPTGDQPPLSYRESLQGLAEQDDMLTEEYCHYVFRGKTEKAKATVKEETSKRKGANFYGNTGSGNNVAAGGGGNAVLGEKLCHKCRQPGHVKRDCTLYIDAGGSGGPVKEASNTHRNELFCRVCRQNGHTKRECAQNNASGRSVGIKVGNRNHGKKVCYQCGRLGHTNRNCSPMIEEDNSSAVERRSDRSNTRTCCKCGQTGHMNRDCPRKRASTRGRGTGGGSRGGKNRIGVIRHRGRGGGGRGNSKHVKK